MSYQIDRLIISSPYEEPSQYWRYEMKTRLFDLAEGTPSGRLFGDVRGFKGFLCQSYSRWIQ